MQCKNSLEKTNHSQNLARILLVEDSEMLQDLTLSLLNAAGFFVEIATTGEMAVEMFFPEKYDLIYMDIGLPQMDGYEATRAIRTKEKALNAVTQIPIIALTGHSVIDVQASCGQSGMQGVLSKPLTHEQAEKTWKYFVKKENIFIPGLMILEKHLSVYVDNVVLDIEATIKNIGIKEIADKLISDFAKNLEVNFLPTIKTLIAEQKIDDLKFLLHQKLGSLAYIKAPLLKKKLLNLQTILHQGASLPQNTYHDIEKEVFLIIKEINQ